MSANNWRIHENIEGQITSFHDATLTRAAGSYEGDVAMSRFSDRSLFNKFAFNLDVDTGSEELISS